MAEEDQEKFKREFAQIKSGNPDHKSDKQLYTIKNVKNLYDSRQKFIDLFNSYPEIRSEAIYKSKQKETKGKGLKILITKQMLKDHHPANICWSSRRLQDVFNTSSA